VEKANLLFLWNRTADLSTTQTSRDFHIGNNATIHENRGAERTVGVKRKENST
jgi:hypothetical protein